MNDRDIEDTRQPKEDALMSDCDYCGGHFPTDDLNKRQTPIGEIWFCDDCKPQYAADAHDEVQHA